MKKLAFTITGLVALGAIGIFAYTLVSPEIVIVNSSASTLQEVIVQLPSNRIVFGEIQPDSKSTIYYSATQSDGEYSYSVSFKGAPPLVGSCGSVTDSEFGKRLQLVVLRNGSVECREEIKIF